MLNPNLTVRIKMNKSNIALTGSEKQIAWANELVEKFLASATKSLPTLIERMNDDVENFDGCSDEYIAEFRLAHKNVIEWLQEDYKSKTSASFWIDNKGRVAWDIAVRTLEKADPFGVDYSLVWAE